MHLSSVGRQGNERAPLTLGRVPERKHVIFETGLHEAANLDPLKCSTLTRPFNTKHLTRAAIIAHICRNYWAAINMKPIYQRRSFCLTPHGHGHGHWSPEPQKLELFALKGAMRPGLLKRGICGEIECELVALARCPSWKLAPLPVYPMQPFVVSLCWVRPPSINSHSLSLRLRDEGGLREDRARLRDLLIAHLELQRKPILRFILFSLLATPSQHQYLTPVELTWYT